MQNEDWPETLSRSREPFVMKPLRYNFHQILSCEMCGDRTEHHRVLGQRLNRSQGTRPRSKTGITVSVSQCTNCRLIYPQPLPIPFDLQDHYGIPPEDYWKPEQFEFDAGYFSREIEVAKTLLGFRPGMTALDIGAGLGKCMSALTRAGFDAFGLEPSLPFYERAQSQMEISPDKLRFGQVEDLDYEDEVFDLITYGAVFEHLYHPAATLEKAIRWLKPNGIVHIEVPSANYAIAKLINWYFKLARTNFVTHLSPMHPPFHLYEFDLRSFIELGRSIGYQVAQHYFEVCQIEFLPRALHPLLRKYMELTDTGMQLTVYLRKI